MTVEEPEAPNEIEELVDENAASRRRSFFFTIALVLVAAVACTGTYIAVREPAERDEAIEEARIEVIEEGLRRGCEGRNNLRAGTLAFVEYIIGDPAAPEEERPPVSAFAPIPGAGADVVALTEDINAFITQLGLLGGSGDDGVSDEEVLETARATFAVEDCGRLMRDLADRNDELTTELIAAVGRAATVTAEAEALRVQLAALGVEPAGGRAPDVTVVPPPPPTPPGTVTVIPPPESSPPPSDPEEPLLCLPILGCLL